MWFAKAIGYYSVSDWGGLLEMHFVRSTQKVQIGDGFVLDQ